MLTEAHERGLSLNCTLKKGVGFLLEKHTQDVWVERTAMAKRNNIKGIVIS